MRRAISLLKKALQLVVGAIFVIVTGFWILRTLAVFGAALVAMVPMVAFYGGVILLFGIPIFLAGQFGWLIGTLIRKAREGWAIIKQWYAR